MVGCLRARRVRPYSAFSDRNWIDDRGKKSSLTREGHVRDPLRIIRRITTILQADSALADLIKLATNASGD